MGDVKEETNSSEPAPLDEHKPEPEESGATSTNTMGDTDKRKVAEEEDRSHRKKHRGMNKKRGPTYKVNRDCQLCPQLVDRRSNSDPGCSVDDCKFTHDLEQYLEEKLPSLGDECYVYNVRGHCPRGLTCRFNSKHTTADGLNIVNESLFEEWKSNKNLHTINSLNHDVQRQLWKQKYKFERASKILLQWYHETQEKIERIQNMNKEAKPALKEDVSARNDSEGVSSVPTEAGCVKGVADSAPKKESSVCDKTGLGDSGFKVEVNKKGKVTMKIGPLLDHDIIKLQEGEKKKIDWRDKLFLSPLTTVGNLPFRRICKEFGADITCGEMAMAANLLQGKGQEWALTKRHGSEDIFGVQVCGGNIHVMTRVAQLVQDQAEVDFVDINVGCPIDLVYQQGAGSGLLNKRKILFSIVKYMKRVLDIPLTLKTRTGVYSGKNVAHLYMKNLTESGADLITIHGRTKEQRYTKLADWDYIEQCAQLAAPTPVIGNGDILSYEDFDAARKQSPTATSVMIGRGALIKPWIFTEVKERRHWDISSQERYQILQRFTNYGLEHWGSDTRGVETTRKFLLEWLSFLYRYIPVGLLDSPPQKMNERPPKFQGRDEMEELMASHLCTDWIKISEMLLGPVPEGFQFIPKHKANSWT